VIIQKQKDYGDILAALAGEENIFLGGCSDCATACKTGGEEELVAMKARLEADGKTVTGMCVFDTACARGAVRQMGREHREALDAADAILLMACGTGVQTVSDALEKLVHVGVDSLFVGEIRRLGKYAERCAPCGHCMLEEFEGICPLTRCAKGLLNGPCGGYNEGMCEVNPDQPCAWIEIYERMKARGKLDKLRIYHPPKAQRSRHTPREYIWAGPAGAGTKT
jgi:hypothetical protein